MAYVIHDNCLACRTCAAVCPQSAPHYDGDRFSIDPALCIDCGRCAAACPEQAIWPEGAALPPLPPVTERESSCDFLVIGAGPAGLCAAARVAEAGKRVIVLERTGRLGGAGVYATIFMATGTQWEKDAGLPDCMDDFIRCAMNATDWKLDPRLVGAGYRATGQFFDWFCGWGDAEACFRVGMTFGGRIGVDLKDPSRPAGSYMVAKAIDYCNKLGVEFRLGHRAERLLWKDGKLDGVVASTEAGKVTIRCKNCLLATGAMTISPDLARFEPVYADAVHVRNAHRFPGSTGDGVRMLEQAGIPIDQTGVASHYTGGMPVFFDKHVLDQALRPDCLKVNLRGERWTNESLERMSTVERLLQQPHGVSYSIVDARLLQQPPMPILSVPYTPGGFMIGGSLPKPGERPHKVNLLGIPIMLDENGEPMTSKAEGAEENRGMGGYAPGALPTHAQIVKLSRLHGGHVFAADTLEDLAAQIGLPEETFLQTVEAYNRVCREKRDTDFYKLPEYLFPIEQGPFYAFRSLLSTDGVFGGAWVDENCQVLDDGAPVPGLFAAGDMTSGNFTKKAGNRVEMLNDFTWAFVSGFLAAERVRRTLEMD